MLRVETMEAGYGARSFTEFEIGSGNRELHHPGRQFGDGFDRTTRMND